MLTTTPPRQVKGWLFLLFIYKGWYVNHYRPVKMLLDLQLIATELKPPAIIQERGYKKHIKNVGAWK